jgi:hypothetical protein
MQGFFTQNNQYGYHGNTAKQNTAIPLRTSETQLCHTQYLSASLASEKHNTVTEGKLLSIITTCYKRLTEDMSHTFCVTIYTSK